MTSSRSSAHGSRKPPFEASRGDGRYIFVSYAHEDSEAVYDELVWLKERGFEIWYDEGIAPGHDWPEALATAIEQCALFLLFVTPRSAASDNCYRETTFAINRGRPFLAVHIEETELPRGLELSIGNSQAIIKHHLDAEAYRRKLEAAITQELGLDERPSAPAAEVQAAPNRKRTMVFAGILVVGALLTGTWFAARSPETSSADLARLQQLIDNQDRIIGSSLASTLDAYLLARQIEARDKAGEVPAPFWDQIALTGKATTEPDNVHISLKVAMDDPQWIDIGTSGQADFRFPRGQFFWRLEKPGYHTKTLYGDAFFLFAPGIGASIFSRIELTPDTDPLVERVSKGVTVPAGVNYVILPFQEVPEFQVDRFEVTNREFKEFVQSGGYDNPAYWQALADARLLDALETFVDRTGRPGPATWEVGTYPSGKADHPVGGISWYEATAYARFRNASLPTIYHWAQAALPFYASALWPLSNLNSGGETSAKAGPPGPWGTYGTYGNVREWVVNAWDDRRWILGGGWSDPAYLASLPFSLPPEDRSPVNGIRLYYFDEPFPEEFAAPVRASYNDYRSIKPVSNDTYAVIADQYVDVGGAIEAKVVAREEEDEWVRETIRISSDIPGEHFDLHLFLPRETSGPSQVVTYFPPISDFWAAANSQEINLRNRFLPLDTVPRSGRALAWPVFYGSFERYFGIYEMSAARRAQLQTEMRVHWYADLKRSLDYLETRDDVAVDRLAWLSYSYGASHALPLLALEKRYDAAILVAGGLGNLGIDPMPQAADPLNFISRIETPVLMINGKNDFVFPLESSQRPLFELLGTPPGDKVKIEYDGDHYQIPATAMTRDMVNWLDERLGPL